MILLCGVPSERALRRVREELEQLAAEVVIFNQRLVQDVEIQLEITGGHVGGLLRIERRSFRLEEFTGVYTRVMDDQRLPELDGLPTSSPARQHSRRVHALLAQWCEVTPARVVNRARPQGSNFSKPYQSQLVRAQGFAIPETLVTNDPDLVRAFLAQHGRVIYKSISGVRSIVRQLTEPDLSRLEQIRWCPVQFQAYVPGIDVRVHVVGGETFATAVESDATDYRYGLRDALDVATLGEVELSDELAARCVGLAAALGLPFAGIDLRLGPAGEVTCFEVNPSPAYDYYESGSGVPIARALARHLLGG